ncbi:MAG: aldehyde dehydrogenase family protein [Proteobacteria bacterium]|nr:aldehyde dehydrogenase family protein [Pseudomonadota bacterium]
MSALEIKSYLNLIDGKYVPAQTGQSLDMINPCNGKTFATIPDSDEADINAAVCAAQNALDGDWGRMAPVERSRILYRWSQLILENFEELASLESRDTGKPITAGRADITAAARYFEFYAGAADKLHGQVIPYLGGYSVSVHRVPYGVTAHIIPWNYPAQQFGRSVGPALAVGNAAVVKPSEDACLTTLVMSQLALEAGLPAGALNIVAGLGESAGAALANHPHINFMSFTGSPRVGTLVQQGTAKHFVGCTLELGGKSPQLIFSDADLDKALPTVVKAIIQHAGQTCSAGSRLLVQKEIYNEFMNQVAAQFAKVRVGTPEMDLDCGPLMNVRQQSLVDGFRTDAIKSGIELLAEGVFADGLDQNGFWVKPALFGNVPRDHRLACDEVFGPVLSAIPFDDELDAIRLSNATDYGLVGSVWTKDGNRQQRVAKRMNCGQVFINNYGAGGGVELPFGGMKKSGHGREKGFIALEHFTTTKTIVHHHE